MIWSDISMIINSPIVKITILKTIYKIILTNNYKINNNDHLKLLTHLYNVGFNSQKIIQKKVNVKELLNFKIEHFKFYEIVNLIISGKEFNINEFKLYLNDEFNFKLFKKLILLIIIDLLKSNSKYLTLLINELNLINEIEKEPWFMNTIINCIQKSNLNLIIKLLINNSLNSIKINQLLINLLIKYSINDIELIKNLILKMNKETFKNELKEKYLELLNIVKNDELNEYFKINY